MKRALIALLIFLSQHAFAIAPSRIQVLASAIAKAEGFGVKGAKPTRYRNPGDIRASKGVFYPGQRGLDRQGYVIFKTEAAGWAALRNQIQKIIDGESRYYSVNSSLRELAHRYATSPTWVRNVSNNLGVTPRTDLWEILDVPPTLRRIN